MVSVGGVTERYKRTSADPKLCHEKTQQRGVGRLAALKSTAPGPEGKSLWNIEGEPPLDGILDLKWPSRPENEGDCVRYCLPT